MSKRERQHESTNQTKTAVETRLQRVIHKFWSVTYKKTVEYGNSVEPERTSINTQKNPTNEHNTRQTCTTKKKHYNKNILTTQNKIYNSTTQN